MGRFFVAVLAVLALAGAGLCADIDKKSWSEVLSGITSDADRRVEEVAAVRADLPALREEANRALYEADNQLTQTQLLRGVAGQSPWSLRTLLAHYASIERTMERGCQKLKLAREHLDRMKQEIATLRVIRKRGPDVDYNNPTVDALAAPAQKLEAVRSGVNALRDEIDASLTMFDDLGEVIEKARQDLREDYVEVFKDHYFGHVRPPLDVYGLALLESRSTGWVSDCPRFLASVAAWTDWSSLCLAWLPAWALLLLGARLAAGRLGMRQTGPAGFAWALLLLGISGYAATYAVPFTGSHVLNLLLVLVTFCGAVVLVRGHLPEVRLGFWLALYAAGTLAQVLNRPAEMICVYWPPVMAVAALVRWRQGLRGSAAWLAAAGALALGGFGPQAVNLVQAWFLFKFTVACSRALRGVMAARGGVWIAYVHPLAVAALSVAYAAWVMFFMGGPGFLDYVFTREVRLGPVSLTLDAVAFMALMFFAARLILAWLTTALERTSVGGKTLDPALAHTFSTLASYATWVGYLLAVLSVLGLPLSGVTWIASGLSVGVGFGLKDIINNFVSGLIILFGGSIKKGDVVQTGKTLGEVTNVSVRNTTVRTLDNSMVIIPNSSFLRGEIINWSYQDKRIRLTIHVSVAPGTKVKKVRKILTAVAAGNDLVLKDPAPSVVLRQLGRYGLDFELYVWIQDFRDKFKVESDLAAAIDQELQENKITVAFQGIKVKYKPRGSEEAQREAQREALREKRRKVFSLVRQLRAVHLRSKWGVAAPRPEAEEQ